MSSHHIYEMILENCHTCYLFMIGLKVSPEVKVGQREPAPSNKEKKKSEAVFLNVNLKFICLTR